MAAKREATVPRADLHRDTVIDRALAISDTAGLEAVTIRRLAADFGVTPMAIYWHVRNKEELLDAMGDRLFDGTAARARACAAAGGSWPAQLRALMQILVDALRPHPNAGRLAAMRILMCEDGRQLTERALEILCGAGMSVREAASVAQQAMLTAIMLISGQPGLPPASTAEEREAKIAGKRAALSSLPADRFPRLLAAADTFLGCEDEVAYYQAGVNLFVAGVEALAPAAAAGAQGCASGGPRVRPVEAGGGFSSPAP